MLKIVCDRFIFRFNLKICLFKLLNYVNYELFYVFVGLKVFLERFQLDYVDIVFVNKFDFYILMEGK